MTGGNINKRLLGVLLALRGHVDTAYVEGYRFALFDIEGERLENFKIAMCLLAIFLTPERTHIQQANDAIQLQKDLDDDEYFFLEVEKKWCRTFVKFEEAKTILKKVGVRSSAIGTAVCLRVADDNKEISDYDKKVYNAMRAILRYGLIKSQNQDPRVHLAQRKSATVSPRKQRRSPPLSPSRPAQAPLLAPI